ncbi:hypothetical protein ZWY2020_017817 [Hordeum vulgare]|nr:hypothetical protein ZWY2020_017817 [Hordeum vulgare]
MDFGINVSSEEEVNRPAPSAAGRSVVSLHAHPSPVLSMSADARPRRRPYPPEHDYTGSATYILAGKTSPSTAAPEALKPALPHDLDPLLK